MQRKSAWPDDPVASMETLALVVDLDPFGRNLELLANVGRSVT